MELRYGLNGSMPRTYQQIGDLLNVSRERVRQIQEREVSNKKLNQQPKDKHASNN